MEQLKRCTKCGRELPLSEFNKNRNTKDGLQCVCRACFSAYNKRRYAANKEKFKADIYAYKKANPLSVYKSRLKVCETHPSKVNARRVVEAGIAAGVLVRPDHCTGCGCSNTEHRIEAHHYDYTRPAEVIWLCTPCHRALDKKRREREEAL